MASTQAATAGLNVRLGAGRAEHRVNSVLVALFIAAVLAALGSIYFGVNAGADYPEPWPQLSD